ncbi:DUF3138 family protein [Hylemonella sp. W303a]|uniref:DUF3138 family protein n=1 Tax=Hylemonella sp. W303a TaxID=3389873 RepID=UPI00396B0ADA
MRVHHRTILAQVAALALGIAAGGQAAAQQNRMGLTPDQMQDINRTIIKTEAMEDAWETAGFKGLKITGYMDPTYIYDQNANRAGFQFLSSEFSGYSDTPFFGNATITFTKETDDGTTYTLQLQPLNGDHTITAASVSIPLSDRQTRMIAGKVLDWSGYEYADPVKSSLITHNLLFDFTLPVAYTGAGLDISTGSWQLRTMLANVDSARAPEGKTAPAWVYRFDYWPEEFWGVGFAGVVGKADNWNKTVDADGEVADKSTAVLFEVDGYYNRGNWTFGGQLSYGTQKDAANDGVSDAKWAGVSTTVGYFFTPRLQFLVRGDYINNEKNGGGLFTYTAFDDGAGVRADGVNGLGMDEKASADCDAGEECKGANRYAVSLGLKYALNPNAWLKFEYRYDGADQDVFYDVKNEEYKKNNNLVGAALVVFF